MRLRHRGAWTRIAAKLAIAGAACVALSVTNASGQESPQLSRGPTKFGVIDNSFLVEEAFNQEAGIFQNIFSWTHDRAGTWEATFTQEWPAPGLIHQFSFTVPFASTGRSEGLRDVLLNYRYQLLVESPTRPALAPRISLIVPTGSQSSDLGLDVYGLQINVPLSKQFGDLYVHANAGWTWSPGVQIASKSPATVNLTSPQVAGSAIWQVTPLLNLMLEGVLLFDETVPEEPQSTPRIRHVTIAPGFRRGWNLPGERQLVVGAAVPVSRAEGSTDVALLGYFSFELPFR